MGTQEFWCWEYGNAYKKPVKILIRTNCQFCQTPINIVDAGNSSYPGEFSGMCIHYATYERVWDNRITRLTESVKVEYGVHCTANRSTKCLGFYSDAEKKSDFICFACRSGW